MIAYAIFFSLGALTACLGGLWFTRHENRERDIDTQLRLLRTASEVSLLAAAGRQTMYDIALDSELRDPLTSGHRLR